MCRYHSQVEICVDATFCVIFVTIEPEADDSTSGATSKMDYSPRPLTKVEQADQALANGEYGLVIAIADEVLLSEPTNTEARRLKGGGLVLSALAHEPRDEDMIKAGMSEIDKALMFEPRDANALYTRAVCFVNLGRHEDAIEDLLAAAEIADNPRVTQSLVSAYLQTGQETRAQEAFDLHQEKYQTPITVFLEKIDAEERRYAFAAGKMGVVLSKDEGLYACDNEELRVYGLADTLEGAINEWTQLFHLNYVAYAESRDPMADDAVAYAEQLTTVAQVTT